MRPFLLIFLLLMAPMQSMGCHRAEVVENVPTPSGLSGYRTVGLLFARAAGANDDSVTDLREELLDRLERTGIWTSVTDGSNADLVIRATVLDAGDEATVSVELLDVRKNALLGRFQVKARKGKAVVSAAREIASYLEAHK